MKVHKTYSIDLDIAERLAKEQNASKIINDMLRKRYEKESLGICEHEWGNWAVAAGGLAKECRRCHEVKFQKS